MTFISCIQLIYSYVKIIYHMASRVGVKKRRVLKSIKHYSGLQIFGNRNEMTLSTSRLWQNPNVFSTKKIFQNSFNVN